MPRSAGMRESGRRITCTLVRSGALVAQQYDGGEQHWLDLDADGEDAHALTQLQSASIRYRIAVGPIAGRKTFRLHTPGAALETPEQPEQPKPLTAVRDGFSLNAALACRADERRKLERLCRYVARPAIALERLRRVFEIDISRCPRCGGRLRVLGVITEARVVAAILAHFERREARAPPPRRH